MRVAVRVQLGPEQQPSLGQIGEFSFILAGLGLKLGLLPEEGFSPPRYRVGDWPDAATMARFREQAEQP